MKKLLLIICVLSYTLHISAQSCDDTLPVIESFDTDVINVCWDVIDGDGDSINWYWWQYTTYNGGHKVIASNSFFTSIGNVTPDNWIMSHAIDLTPFNDSENITLSWKVRGELEDFSHEYYTVYVATNNEISAFESSPVKRGEYVDEVGGAGVFVTRTLDVSSLIGNMVYIAFRHHISTEQFNINIDDVTINTGTLGIDDFQANSFKHYYNSGTDVLTLNSQNTPINEVEIYNLLGQQVLNKNLSQTEENLELSNLTDGIYIAKILIDKTYKTIKFLKQ